MLGPGPLLPEQKSSARDALRGQLLAWMLVTTKDKGQHPDQLLSVVVVDPNIDIYPIAYAMAEAENYKTETWFLELLVVDIGFGNSNRYVFITDR
ncbi:hypothetical protein ACE6H2_026646 [Prunus campanulata]